MDRLIKINGKTYKAAEFDVNFMCELEDNRIKLEEIDDNMFKVVRIYAALCMDTDVKTAGKEIKSPEELEEISKTMTEMMEESDFFRTEPKNKDQTSPARTAKKKSESEDATI